MDVDTKAWEKYRRGEYGIRQGGSDAGKICGLYKTPLDHYHAMIREIDDPKQIEEEEEACKHGHRCEPLIAEMYAEFTGNELKEPNYWEPEDPLLRHLYGCTPDRKVYINGKFEGLLEIKAPYSRMYEEPKPEHVCQMMFQMWITKKPWCDYMAVKLDHDNPEEDRKKKPPYLLLRIFYNKEYVENWMKPRLFYFSECLMTRHEPQLRLFFNKPPPQVSMIQKYKPFQDRQKRGFLF